MKRKTHNVAFLRMTSYFFNSKNKYYKVLPALIMFRAKFILRTCFILVRIKFFLKKTTKDLIIICSLTQKF
jgi:hypothetical protein